MSLRDSVHDLYQALHKVELKHSEMGDTEVREVLGWTLHHFFVWNQSKGRLPKCYGLLDTKANIKVAKIVADFLKRAQVQIPKEKKFATPRARLNLLQNKSFAEESGAGFDYGTFIGHAAKPGPKDEPPPTFIDIFGSSSYPQTKIEPAPKAPRRDHIIRPIFGVADMEAALTYYREKLSIYYSGHDGDWAIINIGNEQIQLHGPTKPFPQQPGSGTADIMCRDIQGHYRLHQKLGARIVEELKVGKGMYGESTYVVADLDGNLLLFNEMAWNETSQ